MVVLEHKGPNGTQNDHKSAPVSVAPAAAAASSLASLYSNSPYVQPLPSESEMDSKISPLAMLTRACNKIEADMMSGTNNSAKSRNNNISPKIQVTGDRPRSADKRSPTSPGRKCSPPLKSAGSSTSKTSYSPPAATKATSPHQSATSPKASSSSAMPYSAAAMAAAAAAGIPPVLPPNSMSPYASMAAPPNLRANGASSPCTDPLCRDPTCPTTMLRQAQYASMMAAAAARNPYMYSGIPGLSLPPGTGPSADPTPYVCNWVNGGDFCGKKFASSEDLMGHLRTHTSTTSSAASTSSAPKASPAKPSPKPATSPDPTLAALQAAQAQAAALYNLPGALGAATSSTSALAALQAQAARVAAAGAPATTATTPSTSSDPLALAYAAAARFHPYARPGAAGLPPPPAAMLPGALPGLPAAGAPGLPPHLSFAFGLPSPYGLPMI